MVTTFLTQWTRCRSWWRSFKLIWMLLFLSLLVISCSAAQWRIVADEPVAGDTAADEGDKQGADGLIPDGIEPDGIEPDGIEDEETVLLAVGDIGDCRVDERYFEATAALVDTLPGPIALLGDIAYPSGRVKDFVECYDPVWGKHLQRSRPVPGNHEYRTDGAAGYYGYYGSIASPLEPTCTSDCKGYYSYEVGEWHVIALNSELEMSTGSEQEQWLRADLASHPSRCTLAYWHHPRFSSGDHGNSRRSDDVWEVLYDAGVDIVLNGHDHNYERFAPQNPDGELDVERGIREFVVGTGGTRLREFDEIQENSEARSHQTWGLLKLTLYAESYEWEFLFVAGEDFVDQGRAPCVRVAGDVGGGLAKRSYLPGIYQ